ncbi:hypothetical protein Hdeb2414_s0173g00822981 [Helianthus debilis subsp. tardiflorus]
MTAVVLGPCYANPQQIYPIHKRFRPAPLPTPTPYLRRTTTTTTRSEDEKKGGSGLDFVLQVSISSLNHH